MMTRTFKSDMNARKRQQDRNIMKALESYPKAELIVMADSIDKLCAAYRTACSPVSMQQLTSALARVKEALESVI